MGGGPVDAAVASTETGSPRGCVPCGAGDEEGWIYTFLC